MDLYPFVDKYGYTGFIDKNGDVKISPKLLRVVEDFYEDRAAARLYFDDNDSDTKCGYIDCNGDWIIEPKYDFVGPFIDGKAVVGFRDDEDDEKYFIIDRFGEVLWDVPQGITVLSKYCPTLIPISNGDKCAYSTATGELITDFEFYDAYPFSDDVGLVRLGKENKDGNSEWCYIKRDGTTLEDVFFTARRAFPFTEGFARILYRVGLEDRYYYIDKNAEQMNSTPFSLAGPFSEGRAYVKSANTAGVWYINRQFQEVLKPDLKFSTNNFSNGLVVVRDNKYNLFGYADTSGRVVIECNYSNNKTMDFKNDLAYVIQDKRRKYFTGSPYRYINSSGETVFELSREMIPHDLFLE